MQPRSVMMALGKHRFSMTSGAYEQFSHTAEYRWNKVDRIGREPAMQYLGPDVSEVTIEGVIYPHFRGGLRQVSQMRQAAGTGEPLMMVDGLGKVWKKWVIVRIEERGTHFLRDGAPRKIEFSLTLKSFGADNGDQAQVSGVQP